MCYQTSLSFDKMALSVAYEIPFDADATWGGVYFESAFTFPERPVIHHQDAPHFSMMRWGLIPHWVKDRKQAAEIRMKTLNAMSETAAEKPSFRMAMKKHPVVIPVGGFFENRHEGKSRIPYFVSGKEEKILSLAGIADEWMNPETGMSEHTFSILTCEAKGIMSFVHNSKNRSPVILQPGAWHEWLNTDIDYQDRLKYAAEPDEILQAWKILPDFNSTKTNKNQEKYLRPYEAPGFTPELF
jgi:putative SOS response-associated peptidase YedK